MSPLQLRRRHGREETSVQSETAASGRSIPFVSFSRSRSKVWADHSTKTVIQAPPPQQRHTDAPCAKQAGGAAAADEQQHHTASRAARRTTDSAQASSQHHSLQLLGAGLPTPTWKHQQNRRRHAAAPAAPARGCLGRLRGRQKQRCAHTNEALCCKQQWQQKGTKGCGRQHTQLSVSWCPQGPRPEDSPWHRQGLHAAPASRGHFECRQAGGHHPGQAVAR